MNGLRKRGVRKKSERRSEQKGRTTGPFAFSAEELRAQVLRVDIDAGLGVVDEIPTGMIGVIVDYEVVAGESQHQLEAKSQSHEAISKEKPPGNQKRCAPKSKRST